MFYKIIFTWGKVADLLNIIQNNDGIRSPLIYRCDIASRGWNGTNRSLAYVLFYLCVHSFHVPYRLNDAQLSPQKSYMDDSYLMV
jgi:hypothetical protein